jgi:glycosyltransferase involved in cell wall biosynthesis
MRIVFFDTISSYGGAQRASIQMLRQIRESDEVSIIDAYGYFGAEAGRLNLLDFKVKSLLPNCRHNTIGFAGRKLLRGLRFLLAMPSILRIIHLLRKELIRTEPDVIQVISPKALTMVLLAVRSLKLPVVYYCHGERLPKTLTRLGLYKSVAAVICLSETIKRNISKQVDRSFKRIFVVPNFVKLITSHAKPELSVDLPDSESEIRIILVGTLLATKGQHIAIQALKRIRDGGGDGVLYFAGDAPSSGDKYKKQLQQMTVDLDVADRVHFLGWCQDVPSILRNCTVLVLPSKTEGLPMALLEGMAVGCPIVATPVGSVPEMLCHGSAGLITVSDSSEELALAIMNTHQCRTESIKRVEKAKSIVEEHYSSAIVGLRYRKVMLEIVGVDQKG